MIFSKKCEYAIRALVDLAQTSSRSGAREISRRQRIPYHFVAKILQELRVKGLLRSARGVGGGFALAKPAEQIQLIEVLEALDCDRWFRRCVYGFPDCEDSKPCPLHLDWKLIRSQVEMFLKRQTIGNLARPLGEGDKPPAGWLDHGDLPFPIR